jgi:hypothetical protein
MASVYGNDAGKPDVAPKVMVVAELEMDPDRVVSAKVFEYLRATIYLVKWCCSGYLS